MKRVERYFHIRPVSRVGGIGSGGVIETKGGATVKVVSADGENCTVQVAFCSANDAFCRKTGRDTATKHPMKVMNLQALPEELGNVARSVTSRVLKLSHKRRQAHPLWSIDFGFATKYFMEKEMVRQ